MNFNGNASGRVGKLTQTLIVDIQTGHHCWTFATLAFDLETFRWLMVFRTLWSVSREFIFCESTLRHTISSVVAMVDLCYESYGMWCTDWLFVTIDDKVKRTQQYSIQSNNWNFNGNGLNLSILDWRVDLMILTMQFLFQKIELLQSCYY